MWKQLSWPRLQYLQGKVVTEGRAQHLFPSLSSRAIVFVVDSVAFQREVKDVAELLYQVLVDSTVLKNAPALLIACNKQGIVGVLTVGTEVVQSLSDCWG